MLNVAFSNHPHACRTSRGVSIGAVPGTPDLQMPDVFHWLEEVSCLLAEVHFYSSLEGNALVHTLLSSDEAKYDRHIGSWMYHECKMISELRFGRFV